MKSRPLYGDDKPGRVAHFVSFDRALAAAVAAYWRNRPEGRRVAALPSPSTSREASGE